MSVAAYVPGYLPATRTDWWRTALLTLLFVLTGKLSLALAVTSGYVALTVFIPVGIALAFTIHYGYRVWPGAFLGQLLLLLLAGQPWSYALMVAVGNALPPVLGAWLFARFRLDARFQRPRDITGLLLMSVLLLQPVSATLGTLPLWLDGRVTLLAWTQLWGVWWLDNLLAYLLFTPLLLTWLAPARPDAEGLHTPLETALTVTPLAGVVGLFVFGRQDAQHFLTLAYCFPFMIFVAMVWGQRGASLAAALLALFSLQATLFGLGSFARQNPSDRIIDINVFIVGIALVGLYLAALLAERRAGEMRVAASERRLAATLENAPDLAVQWYDAEGRILFWNCASEKLYGLSAAEARGKTPDQLGYPAEATAGFLAALRQIGSSGQVIGPYESVVHSRDSRELTISSTIFAIPGEGGARDAAPIYACMDVDITERKRAEQALRASEQRFRQLYDNVHEAVAVHALDGRPLHANRRMLELYKVSAEEFGSYSIARDFSAPGMPVETLPALWAEVMAGNERHFEWRARRPGDGHEFDVDVTLTRFRYGDEDAILVTERDITESKRASLALHESEQRFRTLFEFAPLAYLSLDSQGRFTDLNQQLTELLGYDREALLGGEFASLMLDPGRFDSLFETFLGRGTTSGELQLRRRDGSIVTLLLEGRLQRGGTWDHMRAHCVLYDISARKRAEDALNRYRFIVNAVQDMMTVVSAEHRYEVVNEAWCRAVHRPRELVIGHHLSEVWGEAVYRKYVAPMLVQCFEGNQAASVRATIELPRLGPRECDISYLPYHDAQEGKTHAVVITRDVTEQVQAERAMLLAMEQADAANRAKSVFLAQMSHELRTPLNAIIGFAQMLDMGVPTPLDPSQQGAVGHILGSGRHLLRLINEVLDLARIESGNLDIDSADLDLAPLVDEVISLTQPAAAVHQIGLRSTCAAGLAVHADANRVRQILLNLLSNAVKYNHEGGMVVVSCQAVAGKVRVTVIDTGPGIPEEKRPQVFQPFQRLGAEHGGTEGTGIGLVVCKRLVEAMQGQIGFESGVGIGSRFWFELPAQLAPREEAAAVISLATPVVTGQVRGRVLYVEDSPANVAVMRHVFRQLPEVELIDAESAEEALPLLRDNPPDLVLMDINLPGMSGLEALRAMRADPRTAAIPVVAVSAAALPGDIRQGLESGFQAYLTKPFDVPELIQMVRDVLGRVVSHV